MSDETSETSKETIIELEEQDILEEKTPVKVENQEGYKLKLVFWLIVGCLSSVSMTIFNKKIVLAFPEAFVLIAIQNLGAVFLTLVLQFINPNWLPLKEITFRQIYKLIVPTLLYILLLWTSLEGLKRVSVPLVIVARNSSPLITSIIETLFFESKYSMDEYVSLVLILLGAVFFGLSDATSTLDGLGWVLTNLFFITAIGIIDKRMTSDLSTEQTSAGISTLKNFMSAPILLGISYLKDGNLYPLIYTLPSLKLIDHMYLALTIFFTILIGNSFYALVTMLSATGVAISQVSYKMATLIFSFIFFPISFKLHGVVGLVMSFVGVAWFSWMRSIQGEKTSYLRHVLIGFAVLICVYVVMYFVK